MSCTTLKCTEIETLDKRFLPLTESCTMCNGYYLNYSVTPLPWKIEVCCALKFQTVTTLAGHMEYTHTTCGLFHWNCDRVLHSNGHFKYTPLRRATDRSEVMAKMENFVCWNDSFLVWPRRTWKPNREGASNKTSRLRDNGGTAWNVWMLIYTACPAFR